MSHTTADTLPTAVTVTAPAEALACVGPVTSSLRWVQSQMGTPTSALTDSGGGAISISGARITMEAIACCASWRGSTGAASAGAAPLGTKTMAIQSSVPRPSGFGQMSIQMAP